MADLGSHAYALDVSGYTVIPAQLESAELEKLRSACDRALQAVSAARAAGVKLPHTGGTDYYRAARCMYCWDAACIRLLEHPTLHALSALTMGEDGYFLWDMSSMAALPTPADAAAATTSWHRDFGQDAVSPRYLWFFFCLDDVTHENGATWIVPGSHRLASRHEPAPAGAWSGDELDRYPSRVQPCATAGDLLVLDPVALHTSGRNAIDKPRRLLNVSVCRATQRPLMDNWTIAGPKVQRGASERLRRFLGAGADRRGLDQTWAVLPPGWQTGESER